MNKKYFYKLRLWVYDDNEDSDDWVDFYLDVREIIGWYIPLTPPEKVGEEESPEIIHIYVRGDVFSVKQEDHIKNYLIENCFPI